jgi:hypothetical protein
MQGSKNKKNKKSKIKKLSSCIDFTINIACEPLILVDLLIYEYDFVYIFASLGRVLGLL